MNLYSVTPQLETSTLPLLLTATRIREVADRDLLDDRLGGRVNDSQAVVAVAGDIEELAVGAERGACRERDLCARREDGRAGPVLPGLGTYVVAAPVNADV